MSSKPSRTTEKSTRPAMRLGLHVEKHLLAYAAAASAGLSSAAPADAQIIYTPSNTPMAIASLNHGPALTTLDLDNDGTPDFSFNMFSSRKRSSSGSTYAFKFYLKVVPDQTGNQAVKGREPATAAALPPGIKIGPQAKFAPGGLYMAFNSTGAFVRTYGSWPTVEYAYVGLKILIDGQIHYGWARVKFPYPGGTGFPSIAGYAYESTPNQPIIAGQTKENVSASAPATLGMLAGGARAVDLWRKQ
jgi:hypothetical protein